MLLNGVLLAVATAAATPAGDHAAVRDVIISAMNDFASAPAQFLAIVEDDASWCDPYPACVHGSANISAFLTSMPLGTSTILLAEPMVTVGAVGGMMTTISFSWPGAAESCLYTADQHVSWNLSATTSTISPKLDYVRWVYNASAFDAAIGSCLGPGALLTRRRSAGIAAMRSREADLQAVHDYVVSLQYSRAKEALICDLLVDAARYCDPYPESCAYGRAGCRAMKGLPNDTSVAATAAAVASQQCRPGSVRPLMPTGPTTGAMYLAYSSASRNGTQLVHKMHHTWAIWELAPVPVASDSAPAQQAPAAPMLASFDWFMPSMNV